METKERDYKGFVMNGFLALLLNLLMIPAVVLLIKASIEGDIPSVLGGVTAAVLSVFWLIHLIGFMTQEPNEARVMVFFGKYKGTFRRAGFYWINPIETCTAECSLILTEEHHHTCFIRLLCHKANEMYQPEDTQYSSSNTAKHAGNVSLYRGLNEQYHSWYHQ